MSIEVKTNVIKRSGEEVSFDLEKIINAIRKANKEVDRLHQMNEYQIKRDCRQYCTPGGRDPSCGECRGYPGYGRNRHHGDAGI